MTTPLRSLFDFNGGVKPDYHKDASTRLSIGVLSAPTEVPTELVIPLHQSIGGTPRPIVAVGEQVKKGQRIGDADGDVSSAVHASTSGTVSAIEMRRMPHPSGLSSLCVVLETDGRDEWIACQAFDHKLATPQEIRDYLRDCGVVGLGGAVFPTHLKLNADRQGGIETLIINGAECEPYITCDDMLMRERANDIVRGVLLMREILGAKQVRIGIEDNKPEAIAAMQVAVGDCGDDLQVVVVPTRYPAGGAKQLIRVITGIEVPHGKRSIDYDVQCFNVATALAIYEAIGLGRPLISRIVTVAGNVDAPRNFDVLIGTPIKKIIAACSPLPDTNRLIMGGPMMGVEMPGDEVPVVKATNCILLGSNKIFPPPAPEMPCIRCGECALACPADLQPLELYWFSRAKIFGKAQEYHLFDCIECGCCSYVCPSNIPLVDYYRFAKSEIWAREKEKSLADEARDRFEFRQFRDVRDEQEKSARLAARAAAAAAAKQLATTDTVAIPNTEASTEANEKAALIAAAIARAREQQVTATPQNMQQLSAEQLAEISAIEARRAEIREQAKPHLPPDA
ncbi:MAG: electron transport complex subunit RsxC [Rhodocyclaceae bacterium]|nr:electron transport complex subunit RsxC [Rhodocyclaceae bacterium]MBP6110107.1 electron transport complex subunit RsxC [Rhodocyclaceae bacterium]MBP6279875.1 electron transport complex subunit RsxC [Rhodocyclaceae bacterium]